MYRPLLLALLLALAPAGVAATRPNIVLVLVDDMGWSDPGFMGNRYHETPAMDRLAADGTVFTQAYAAAPNCKPSRASLLTGLYPPRHGIYSALPTDNGPRNEQRVIPPRTRFQLAPGTATLASHLQALGYATALVGKWDLGFDHTRPEAFGFGTSIGGFRGGMLPDGFFAPYGLPGLDDAPPGEYLTDRLGHEAVRFIEAHAGQPFFLLLSHYAVHIPLQAPEASVAHFRTKPRDGHAGAHYAAMLQHVDRSIALLLDALQRLQLQDNTLIIVTSDNGSTPVPGSGALLGGKGSLREGGIRVPLLFYGPGQVARGQRVAAPVHGIDIAPTVLDLAGHRAPGLDGHSLLPCLRHADCDAGRTLFWHFPAYLGDYAAADGFFATRPGAALRQGPLKLLQDLETGALSLYDLERDPGETTDIAADDPQRLAALAQQLAAWQQATGAAMPVANPDWHALSGWAQLRFGVSSRWLQWRASFFGWLAGRFPD